MRNQPKKSKSDEGTIRTFPIGSLMAIKWLRETRDWSVKESKKYFEKYRQTIGIMTYGHVFEGKNLPDKVYKETADIWDQDYDE